MDREKDIKARLRPLALDLSPQAVSLFARYLWWVDESESRPLEPEEDQIADELFESLCQCLDRDSQKVP